MVSWIFSIVFLFPFLSFSLLIFIISICFKDYFNISSSEGLLKILSAFVCLITLYFALVFERYFSMGKKSQENESFLQYFKDIFPRFSRPFLDICCYSFFWGGVFFTYNVFLPWIFKSFSLSLGLSNSV